MKWKVILHSFVQTIDFDDVGPVASCFDVGDGPTTDFDVEDVPTAVLSIADAPVIGFDIVEVPVKDFWVVEVVVGAELADLEMFVATGLFEAFNRLLATNRECSHSLHSDDTISLQDETKAMSRTPETIFFIFGTLVVLMLIVLNFASAASGLSADGVDFGPAANSDDWERDFFVLCVIVDAIFIALDIRAGFFDAVCLGTLKEERIIVKLQ